jgi:hypothetical protein
VQARRERGSMAEHAAEGAPVGSAAGGLDPSLGDPDLALQACAGAVVGHLPEVGLGDSEAPARLLEVDLRDWLDRQTLWTVVVARRGPKARS